MAGHRQSEARLRPDGRPVGAGVPRALGALGAGLCYTPMLHAGLAAGDSGIQYLERQFTTRRGDWPLSAQFAGHDPSVVCKAAERTLALAGDNVDNIVALDLNLGCPQQIARRGRYGAWLWERDADAAVDVIRALRTHFATDERVVTREGSNIAARRRPGRARDGGSVLAPRRRRAHRLICASTAGRASRTSSSPARRTGPQFEPCARRWRSATS